MNDFAEPIGSTGAPFLRRWLKMTDEVSGVTPKLVNGEICVLTGIVLVKQKGVLLQVHDILFRLKDTSFAIQKSSLLVDCT